MTTSSSSVIIILVLNILSLTPSFVSSTERRNDDVTMPELHTLVQQQAVTIQQQGVTIQQQAALLQTVQAKLTADENVIQQQGLNIQQQGVTIQQQSALLQTLQAKLTADESTIQQQGVTIQQLQAKQSTMEARQNKNVAFTATNAGGGHVNIGEHGIVIFNQVITNIGGALNTATGIVTASLAGTYAFFFTCQSDNAHATVFMEVTKNGNSPLCRTVMESSDHGWYDKGVCLGVSHLNAGDLVFTRQYGGDTYINEDDYCSFSGFLVTAD